MCFLPSWLLALIGTRIRPNTLDFWQRAFSLSGTTSAISDLALLGRPEILLRLYLFRGLAYSQAVGEDCLWTFCRHLIRAQAAMVALVARFGFKGLLTLSTPWRFPVSGTHWPPLCSLRFRSA